MEKVFNLFFVSLCFGIIGLVLWAGTAYAQPPGGGPPGRGGVPACQADLNTCTGDLATCEGNLAASDGFVDNGDGTVTDVRSGLMWEKKDSPGGGDSVCPGGPTCDNPHDVDNIYAWSSTGVDPDGPAFMDFLDKLNNGCNNDPSVDCSAGGDAVCIASVGGPCGFAGYTDWRLPEAGIHGGRAELEGIVSLAQGFCGVGSGACISPVFGPTVEQPYWSATTSNEDPFLAWVVDFDAGNVTDDDKFDNGRVRAVRP